MRDRNWNIQLVKQMDAALKQPFTWEAANCGDLMATAVRACYSNGHPLLEEITHGTEQEVGMSISERGGLDVILGKHLSEVPVLMAQDGDLATLGQEPLERAGCVVLGGMLVGRGTDRPVWRIPIRKAAHVYRL